MKKTTLALLLVLLLGPLLASPAFAQGGDEGRVIFGQDYTLKSGEELEGDLVVFGGDLTVEGKARLDGDAVAFGGDVFIAEGGQVEGDVATIGGQLLVAGEVRNGAVSVGGDIRLDSTAHVGNDVVAVFGQVERSEGAYVGGQVTQGAELRLGPLHQFQWGGVRPWRIDILNGFLYRFFRALVTIVALMALGLLVAALLPEQVKVIGEAAQVAPFPSIGVGFLTFFVSALLIPLLVVICIGIPVAILLGLALAAASIYGWIVMGILVGQRLLQAAKVQEPEALGSALLGVFLITLISATPLCIGFLFTLAVASWGLGAVILTRFGTTPYQPTSAGRSLSTGEEKPKES